MNKDWKEIEVEMKYLSLAEIMSQGSPILNDYKRDGFQYFQALMDGNTEKALNNINEHNIVKLDFCRETLYEGECYGGTNDIFINTLIEVLKRNISITILGFYDCDLRYKDVKAIVDFLKTNNNIKEIDLGKNYMGNDSILLLASLLESNPEIKIII